jgi:hypothetical protein
MYKKQLILISKIIIKFYVPGSMLGNLVIKCDLCSKKVNGQIEESKNAINR